MDESNNCDVYDCTNSNTISGNSENETDSTKNLNIDETANGLQTIEISNQNYDSEKSVNDNPLEDLSKFYIFVNYKEIAKFNGSSSNKKHFGGCKWSPDGTCLLTNCADYTLRIFDLPKDIHSKNNWDASETKLIDLVPSLSMVEGGIVYDYEWYPYMSSWDPLTCCFISSSSGSPVHLWDAYTGKIRASYRAYDYADEVHAALSLAFSSSGEQIYCGFRNTVKIFDLSKPGRECDILNLKTISGQKGLVSCICENPLMPELFAVGTYSKNIGLYTKSSEFICMLTGQKNGLTQIKFSNDGVKLFSGGRVDNEIICWDIRNPGTVLSTFDRVVTTNQRIYFDLSLDNRYLITGGTDGICRIWDLLEETKLNSDGKFEQTYDFTAHNDCVNGVSLHARYPLIATASGQYHYPDLAEDEDEKVFSNKSSKSIDNSIKLWWVGEVSDKNDSMNVEN